MNMFFLIMGIIYICLALSALILKKYPLMNYDFFYTNLKPTIKDKEKITLLDGIFFLSIGIGFVIYGLGYEYKTKPLIIFMFLYVMLKNRLFTKNKNYINF